MRYIVTFIGDYFTLTTTVGIEADTLVANEILVHKANELVKAECGFSPIDYAYDFQIEEASI
jgi:hypothetical protein